MGKIHRRDHRQDTHTRQSYAPKQAAAKEEGVFRVASFNVENLFDQVDDPRTFDEETPPKTTQELRNLARTLKSSGADVIALQEVENVGVLKSFLDERMPGLYPHVALVEGNDPRGIDVAVISKHPITGVKSHKGNRWQVPSSRYKGGFKRDFLKVDVQVGKYPVSVFTTHFKSQGGGKEADDQRLGEALEGRRIVQEEMRRFPGRRIVVTGDFNDTPRSRVAQVFLPRSSNDWHLNDGLASVPGNQRITHDPTHRTIDYVMYSDSMKDEYIGGGIQVLPEPERGSDHYLIYADFKLQGS